MRKEKNRDDKGLPLLLRRIKTTKTKTRTERRDKMRMKRGNNHQPSVKDKH